MQLVLLYISRYAPDLYDYLWKRNHSSKNATTMKRTKCHIWCPVFECIKLDTRLTVPLTMRVAVSNCSPIPDMMVEDSRTAPCIESDIDLRVSTFADRSRI